MRNCVWTSQKVFDYKRPIESCPAHSNHRSRDFNMLARTSLLLVVAVIAKVTLAQDGDYKVRKTAESCHDQLYSNTRLYQASGYKEQIIIAYWFSSICFRLLLPSLSQTLVTMNIFGLSRSYNRVKLYLSNQLLLCFYLGAFQFRLKQAYKINLCSSNCQCK
jgi:hypothetical protein